MCTSCNPVDSTQAEAKARQKATDSKQKAVGNRHSAEGNWKSLGKNHILSNSPVSVINTD